MTGINDRPADTWRVMDRHQRTIAYVEGETHPQARAAVERRLDLLSITERGFYLRRLLTSEVPAAHQQWAEARHAGTAGSGPWSSHSLLLPDGSYALVTPGRTRRHWRWTWRAGGTATGPHATRLSPGSFRSAQEAMAAADEELRPGHSTHLLA
ncbi:MAG: hypothetical protein ACRDNF_10730 [Streptosporangiaceae bacterium]